MTRDSIEATYKAGVNSFFSKPRDFDELVELAKILNQYWTTKVHLPSACKTKE
jgi:hypothetical protein